MAGGIDHIQNRPVHSVAKVRALVMIMYTVNNFTTYKQQGICVIWTAAWRDYPWLSALEEKNRLGV